jgi:hypothetical protein
MPVMETSVPASRRMAFMPSRMSLWSSASITRIMVGSLGEQANRAFRVGDTSQQASLHVLSRKETKKYAIGATRAAPEPPPGGTGPGDGGPGYFAPQLFTGLAVAP